MYIGGEGLTARIEAPLKFRQEIVRLHEEEQGQRGAGRRNHHAGDVEDCMRKLAYSWYNFPVDNPSRNGFTLTMGKATEAFVEELLSAKLGSYEKQYRIEVMVGNRKIAGYIDFYMDFNSYVWQHFFQTEPRGKVPLEVKTMNTKKYEEQVTKGPPPYHVSQLNTYICGTGSPFGLLMCIQREAADEIPFTFWLVRPDLSRYNWVLQRLQRLNGYLDRTAIPPPKCKQNRLDPYCPWKNERCPKDGGWPVSLCKQCGDPIVNLEDHADCIFGGGTE